MLRSDPEVRRAVEVLLLHESSDNGLLEQPAWELADSALDPPCLKPVPGDQLGPYRVDAKVGAGGMGEVYRATDTRLNRVVAVKVCRSQFTNRFEREARSIAALNHPNICQIYDVGPNYIVMEWVDGTPVVCSGQAPMPLGDVPRLAIEIVSAMAAAHAKGIIHRDLKPANIVLSKVGTAKLLDFGIARQLQREKGRVLESLTIGRLGSLTLVLSHHAVGNDLKRRQLGRAVIDAFPNPVGLCSTCRCRRWRR